MAVGTSPRKKLSACFDDEVRFFKGWLRTPKAVGSIIPTSSVTARKMASVIDAASGLPVLELGPGTGVITKAILGRGIAPGKLTAVEYSPEFVRHLRRSYPGVNVIEGDAFNLGATLGEARDTIFDCAISGVPLLNFPVEARVRYLEQVLDRIPIGRPVVQLTYGPKSPIPAGRGTYTIEHFRFVFRNIPPTQLWIYRRRLPN
jgi:phosphatidylethanolamine/phosphatidyl-N-methylethanolamine N-methyltransferase